MEILERFTGTLGADDAELVGHVQDYIEWYTGGGVEFLPNVNDDVYLRTYLLKLRTGGMRQRDQKKRIASLRRFYEWALDAGFVTESPFEDFSIERPTLSPDQIRRREEIFSGTPEEREIARLKALNRLAEQLNRTPDMQTTLAMALETLLSLMSLQTGWVFLLPSAGSQIHAAANPPPHDFALAATCGLPPGLEQNDRHHLCKPADCHCQAMLRAGQMRQAVNVVECTRLQESANDEGDNQGLLFHASVPIIISGDSVGLLNVATDECQFLTSADLQLLSAIGAQVAIALERARLFDQVERQRHRLERELLMASEVQSSLLPERLAEIPGYSMAVEWRPAREMAGDFYDVFPLPDGRWAFVIADVSDKGAPAAMIMAMARSLIRDSASLHASPAAALREVNQRITAHSTSGMFVTVCYALLDAAAATLTYANAGHNPPLLRRATGSIESLPPTGPLVGVFEELAITDAALALAPGDSLVAYTDGVIDAQNSLREDYGLTRLTRALAGAPGSDASLQLAHLSGDIASFTGEVPPGDDLTLLVVVKEGES